MLAGLGRLAVDHRRWVVAAWLVSLLVVMGAGRVLGGEYVTNPQSPSSESTDGFDLVDRAFGGLGSGLTGTIVFRADAGVDDPAVVAVMGELFDRVAAIDGVAAVESPYAGERGAARIARSGPDAGRIAYATVDLDRSVDRSRAEDIGIEIGRIVDEVVGDTPGLQVEIGGSALASVEPPSSELIGLAFAIVVLIVAFGSVLAMGLPIGVALAGVGTGIGLITLLSRVTTMPEFATTIGAMIGLGVGIDYALFIVTRHREGTARGLDTREAIVRAIDTAGRAVIFAGATVVVSLLGMLLIGLPFVSGLALGAAVTVGVTMVASVTLLPALVGFAGHRLEVTRRRGLVAAALVALALLGAGLHVQPLLVGLPLAVVVLAASLVVAPLRVEVRRRGPDPGRETVAHRWSRLVQAHPWWGVLVGAGLLAVLAAPVFSMRLGFSDEGNFTPDTTTRRAYDLLAEGFGPGFNGPLLVAVDIGDPADAVHLAELTAALGDVEGVARVAPPVLDDPTRPSAALIQVVPTTSPQDEATTDLVRHLRADVIPAATAGTTLDVMVTGRTAAAIDFTDYLAGRLVVFIAAVLAVSFLLLMAVFRSLLVPLKAVIMNVLSIAAAYGVAVAAFQWGWGASVLDVAPGAPIEPFLPMMMFAIVFGLSMDYEVFLLSRVKEEFVRTGRPDASVTEGLAATARVISAAAAIMVVVFGSFVFDANRIVKLFGTGMAVAVLLDATVVRLLLVPSTMQLLGRLNWWLPGWLDRILPRLDVEGHGDEPPEPPAPSPERELVGV